mgnify:FL=1
MCDCVLPRVSQDWFISRYGFIHDRDLTLMRNMNVTVIRVWEWFFANDHTEFLDKYAAAPLGDAPPSRCPHTLVAAGSGTTA